MTTPFVFAGFASAPWWRALGQLTTARRLGDREAAKEAYALLLGELAKARLASLGEAVAEGLLAGEPLLARGEPIPAGLRRAAVSDLELLVELLDEADRLRSCPGLEDVPALEDLAESDAERYELARRLREEPPDELLEALLARYRRRGTGIFSRYRAFRWRGGALQGVARQASDDFGRLVGLDGQVMRLRANVERFLAGAPALHTLLYGPRGSGKSTAVRALASAYAESGLRLVEVLPDELRDLPEVVEALAEAPFRFIAFVDDLSFEELEHGYRPLKTILEGSVAQTPENLLIVATSNRRHLVRERFSERPPPENDDVHGWDTANEKLALADRFGLAITFPGADQRGYLAIVRQLAASYGVPLEPEVLEREALRFAEWGNGYSGRTARQFIDSVR